MGRLPFPPPPRMPLPAHTLSPAPHLRACCVPARNVAWAARIVLPSYPTPGGAAHAAHPHSPPCNPARQHTPKPPTFPHACWRAARRRGVRTAPSPHHPAQPYPHPHPHLHPGSHPKTPKPQAAKAAAAAAAPSKKEGAAKEDGAASLAGLSLEDDSTEITDPSAYFENRVRAVNAKKAKGLNPYPHKFNVSSSIPAYIEKYSGLAAGEQLTDVTVSLAGGAHGRGRGPRRGLRRPGE